MWLPLAGAIEERWRTRFGADAVDRLRTALLAVVGQVGAELPRYLPVVVHGLRTLAPHLESVSAPAPAPDGAAASALDLSALLAQTLLLFAVDVERESVLSFAISANAMRVIDDDGIRVRDLPASGRCVEGGDRGLAQLPRAKRMHCCGGRPECEPHEGGAAHAKGSCGPRVHRPAPRGGGSAVAGAIRNR